MRTLLEQIILPFLTVTLVYTLIMVIRLTGVQLVSESYE